MKFAHSLDDSALAAFAGLVTAVVAGTTAFSSGYSVLRHGKDTSAIVEYGTPIIMPTPMALDMAGPVTYLQLTGPEDTGGYMDTSSSPASLCEHVEAGGDDVDTMNADLEVIIDELKARKGQRRK